MPRQGIAPAPQRIAASTCLPCGRGRRRLQASFRRVPDCAFWRLGFRQSSFRHITRIPRRTAPYAWARSPVSWPANFPSHLSDHGSAIRSKDTSSSLRPLRGLYSSAPRGARRFRACWAVHAPVGCAVTPRMCTRRVSISITKKMYRRLRNTVSTCKKSHDRIPDAWEARNCRQLGDVRRGAGVSPAAARIRRIVPSPIR